MENKKIIVDTKLGVTDYLQVVNDIVLEYFNVDGDYQPHIGILNAMRVFYNVCVKESKFDKEQGHDIFDVFDMENILNDEEFIMAFHHAIIGTIDRLDFASAYKQALKIVNTKKSSWGNAIEIIRNAISELLNSVNDMFKDENLDRIADIAEKISTGKINADTIVEAYRQSQRFKDVINDENHD